MHEISDPVTAKTIAENEGVTVDAIRARWKDAFGESPFDRFAELSPDQVAAISRKQMSPEPKKPAKPAAKKPANNSGQSPVKVREAHPLAATQKQRAPMSADWLLDAINYAEMCAAFVGFVLLFQWLGVLPACMCVGFYAHAMAVMRRPGAWNSASLAQWVCFVLSAVFGWVHFQTFSFALTEFRPDIDGRFWICLCGAALLSGVSLMALYQAQNTQIDKA